MKVIYLKDRSFRPAYLTKTQELLGHPDLGSELIHELEKVFSEPLDSIDADEVTKARLRETY